MAAKPGFTLLELLAVLAIVGLIAALAVPQLGRGSSALALRAAATDLAARLRTARGDAIADNREVIFRLDRDAADGTVLTLEAAAAPGGRRMARAVRFFPDGSSSGGLITLANGEIRRQIAVDWLTGGVRVRD